MHLNAAANVQKQFNPRKTLNVHCVKSPHLDPNNAIVFQNVQYTGYRLCMVQLQINQIQRRF